MHRRRHLDAVAADDVERIGAGGRIGRRRPRGDVHGVVAGHVGNQQRHHLRRMAGGGQAPALDRGQVPAHAVHFTDRRAGLQQRPVDGLLVGERQPRDGQRQQRRPAAGDEAQHQVIRGEALDQGVDALRRGEPGGIGHRVRRLDDLDPLARHAVAVAGDDEARQRARPVVLDGPRHRRRRLAGADHDDASGGGRGQMRRQAMRRLGRVDRGVEHLPQELARGRGIRCGHGVMLMHSARSDKPAPACRRAVRADARTCLTGKRAGGAHRGPAVTRDRRPDGGGNFTAQPGGTYNCATRRRCR